MAIVFSFRSIEVMVFYRIAGSLLAAALLATMHVGCNSTPGMQKVTGTVKFSDGAMPTAEIAVIRFEPVPGTQAPDQSKAASGDIKPDGSYALTTINTGDGAYVGEYKVTFTVLKTYVGRESLVDPKFTAAATTPHTAKVTAAGPNKFDFEISKAPGQ
jgi:hypothetical protein